MTPTRRTLLKAAAAAPIALAVAPAAAGAAPGVPSTQVLGIQHFRAGDGIVTALLDGHLDVGADVFSGLTAEDAERLLAAAYRGAGPVPMGVNAYVYRTATRTILIDAGGGTVFPGLGALADTLAAAGIAPADVDAVLCTHLHPDHAGGLVGGDGPAFPNAALMINEADVAFWTSAENRAAAPESFRGFFDIAAQVVAAYGDRLSPFSGETELAGGVQAVPLPGHTPGHTGFQIGAGDTGLLVWGDIVHVEAFQLPQPTAAIGFDVDQAAAVATRQAILDRVVAERTRIAGTHLSFPGIGHVVRAAEGYAFRPAAWTFDLD